MARTWQAKPILNEEYTKELSLYPVYVGTIKEKRHISKILQTILTILPGFHHLKRCSGQKVLLIPHDDDLTEVHVKNLLQQHQFDLSLLEESFELINVPSELPKTKSQASKASKIWPSNFHPDLLIERTIDGTIFNERQWCSIGKYMKVAIEAAKLESIGTKECNGSAVIVNPKDGQILAVAASRINQHPMWHAGMLAIDLVATLQGGGAWSLITPESSETNKRKYKEATPLYYPATLSKINDIPQEEDLQSAIESKINSKHKESTTYLCTGYWVFLLQEPCPLCAMGLLHSRINKIFYGTNNPAAGILGSKAILHAIPGLNHRYSVWSGILEQECHETLQEIERRNIV